jgi:hypothetical protein
VRDDARTEMSCLCSRSAPISASTSPALRTPTLTSLPWSSLKMRTAPERITYTPLHFCPASNTVSPKSNQRESACIASCWSSCGVNAENISMVERKLATASSDAERSSFMSISRLTTARSDLR